MLKNILRYVPTAPNEDEVKNTLPKESKNIECHGPYDMEIPMTPNFKGNSSEVTTL